METISIWGPSEIADDLDEIAERWDRHSDTKVKRSVPGREALILGVAMLEMMEQNWGTRKTATESIHAKKGAARQGIIEYFDESGGEESSE